MKTKHYGIYAQYFFKKGAPHKPNNGFFPAIVFENKKKAENYLDCVENCNYILSEDEIKRPKLEIKEV